MEWCSVERDYFPEDEFDGEGKNRMHHPAEGSPHLAHRRSEPPPDLPLDLPPPPE
jgi:hypothetical protein